MYSTNVIKEIVEIQKVSAKAMDEYQRQEWLKHINSRPRKKKPKR